MYRGDRSTLLYSIIIRLYALNPVFEIVHDESVKVYLHIVQRECSAEPSMVRILCHYVQFLSWESLSVDEHKRSPARIRYSNHLYTTYVQNFRQTPHRCCCGLLTPKFHDF